MRDPREALSAVLAEQSPDDDDLRDWLTDRAAFVLDALEAEGYRIVGDREWLMQTVAVEIDNECLGLDAPRLETVTAAVVDAVLKEAS